MRKSLLIALNLSLIFSNTILFAKPVLTQSRYLIAVLSAGTTGTVSPGTANYPLVYYPDRNDESAFEADYWIIEEQENNRYSFRNASTLQYISYNTSSVDCTALMLVDELAADKSTLFTLELTKANNLPYYIIRSVIHPAQGWNKRETQYESLCPVVVYNVVGSSNELFIFYDSEGESVNDDSTGAPELLHTSRTLGAFQQYVDSISFNAQMPVVDTYKREFYLTIPESQMDGSLTMNVHVALINDEHMLFIKDELVTNEADFNFGYVSASSSLPIEIRNNSSVIVSGELYFSCLPLVQIYSEANISTVYGPAGLIVVEPEKPDKPAISRMNIKIRGALASVQPKKAFAVKLKDADGLTAIDRSFFGLRNDNNWILDAMHIDPARMRNRVSTDLWNDFSTKPYYYVAEPELVTGTRGHFVEVFLNDAYYGLYCMTEKVDRKQLKLKKLIVEGSTAVQRGGLYKGKDWNSGTFGGNLYWDGNEHQMSTSYNNNSGSWSGFEVKYPKYNDGEPIDWEPLVDAITVSSHLTNDADFRAHIATYFDLPVFLDYYLFIELMLATDNHGKNTYFSVYDQTLSRMLTITPWDCDGTWGRRWEGSSNLTGANQDFDTFISWYEHAHNNLFLRLKSLNYDDYKNKLIDRYKALRGSYFAYKSLIGRFEKYHDLFEKSGAAARERNRWGVGDFEWEMSFLSNWIAARLSYLDNQYLGGPYVPDDSALVENQVDHHRFGPNPVQDMLILSNLDEGDPIQIVSIQGEVIIRMQSNGNEAKVNMSSCMPGIYLLKIGDKVSKIVKL